MMFLNAGLNASKADSGQENLDGWSYRAFHIDTPASELGVFQDFKAVFDAKRAPGSLPTWDSYGEKCLEPWRDQISLEEVLPGDFYNARFQLWGATMAHHYNIDLTGEEIVDHAGTVFSEFDLDISRRVVTQQLIVVSHGPIDWYSPDMWRFSDWVAFIQVPISDDGKTVSRVLSLMLEADQEPPFDKVAGSRLD